MSEEQTAKQDADGSVWLAVNIVPGWSFSVRDADDTIISGIRVVYHYDADPSVATQYEEWYYMTDADGVETCQANKNVTIAKQDMTYLGPSCCIRGAAVEGWESVDSDSGNSVSTWYAPDVNGTFPFRTKTKYADQSSGASSEDQ